MDFTIVKGFRGSHTKSNLNSKYKYWTSKYNPIPQIQTTIMSPLLIS